MGLFDKSEGSRREEELQAQIKALEDLVIRQEDLLEQQKKLLQKYHKDEMNQLKSLKSLMEREFARRDAWPVKSADYRRQAGDRPLWVIKSAFPEDDRRFYWGDYAFGQTLKHYLEEEGAFVVLQPYEDWGMEIEADVVLVLRGYYPYLPDRRKASCTYILWNISHPDMVSDAEYESYDLVCVGSRHYAKELQNRLKVRVEALLQCTDTDIFCPDQTSLSTYEKYPYPCIFIGNSRGVARSCVLWAIEDKLPFTMWGSGWDKILKEHMNIITAPYIDNSQIPDLYRKAGFTLNDHWEDMKQKQFVNNRIFDALACGLPVVSDTFPELEELFPDAVLHYTDRNSFEACLKDLEENYPAIKTRVLAQQDRIKAEFSFQARARELVELANTFH